MRPLKIALLSRWYAEEHRRTGGGGTVQELAEAVAAMGHEVVVLSQSKSASKMEKTRLGNLEVWLTSRDRRRDVFTGLADRLLKRRYGHRKVLSDALDLNDFLNQRGPFDVLWAQCEEPDGLVAAMATTDTPKRTAKFPPTLTQVYALRYRFGPPLTFTEHRPLRRAFRHATRILADSELVAHYVPAYAGTGISAEQLRGKTHVVYHNLQSSFLSAAQAANPGPEPGRVLFLGALNEKKGALVFLDAITGMETTTGATFAVIGDTTEENAAFDRRWATQLAATRERGVKLELLGRLAASEVIAQIRRASVVVLPSLFDEFSRALVEALALGRPVVTTETVGASTFVRSAEAGLVVPPGDAGALRGAILEVLRHHARYLENARACAPRLCHELSPHAIALQIARHLSEIAVKS